MCSTAYAYEPVLITVSENMDKVVFDGKWTFFEEWKASSENVISYDDGTKIHLRSAHQGDYIYFFIDVLTDTSYDIGADNAMICLDGNNDKSDVPDLNDYCFSIAAGKSYPVSYQGNGLIGMNGYFTKIPNSEKLISVSNMSDQNDRYSKRSHIGYEFRIPTELVGRYDSYGLFVSVFDSHTKKIHTWPEGIESRIYHIPSPSKWGDMISPDRSLPELPKPIFLLLTLSILPISKIFKRSRLFR